MGFFSFNSMSQISYRTQLDVLLKYGKYTYKGIEFFSPHEPKCFDINILCDDELQNYPRNVYNPKVPLKQCYDCLCQLPFPWDIFCLHFEVAIGKYCLHWVMAKAIMFTCLYQLIPSQLPSPHPRSGYMSLGNVLHPGYLTRWLLRIPSNGTPFFSMFLLQLRYVKPWTFGFLC